MHRILLLFLFLPHFVFAQLPAHRPVHLKEVLAVEKLSNSYPVFFNYAEGLEESQPLQFYEYQDDVERFSTYYFSKRDSVLTKAVIQHAKFAEDFSSDITWSEKEFDELKKKYFGLQELFKNTYNIKFQYYNEVLPNQIKKQTYLSPEASLYNPKLTFTQLDLGERKLGVLTEIYENQAYLAQVHKELEFLSYYFLENVKYDNKELVSQLVDEQMKQELVQHPEVLADLGNILKNRTYKWVDYNSGYSDIHQEYILIYQIFDEAGEHDHNMIIAYNNQQDIIYIQYSEVQ